MMAGIYIGIGALVYTLCPNKIVGSVLFSVGLLSILHNNLDLYTGRVGYYVWDRKWKELASIWVGNFIGIAMVALVSHFSRLGVVVDANVRVNDSWYSLLMLGIGCGILMYTATTIKLYSTIVILCVATFINCCFEHCVADMYYLLLSNAGIFDIVRVLFFVTVGNTIGGAMAHKMIN